MRVFTLSSQSLHLSQKQKSRARVIFLRTPASSLKPQGYFCLRRIWTNWNDSNDLFFRETVGNNFLKIQNCRWLWFLKSGGMNRINYCPERVCWVLSCSEPCKVIQWVFFLQSEKVTVVKSMDSGAMDSKIWSQSGLKLSPAKYGR